MKTMILRRLALVCFILIAASVTGAAQGRWESLGQQEVDF